MTIEVVAPVLLAPKTPQEMLPIVVDAPALGEVRVKMVASGVCHSCLHVVDGSHAGAPLPIVLGDEGAGIVESVGEGVDHLAPGDHVVISWAPSCGRCRYCALGRPALCAGQPRLGLIGRESTRFHLGSEPLFHFGPATNSPYIVVHSSSAIPIDSDVPLEVAALIGCCVTTGVGAVINTAGVRPGDSLAVVGAGGVGLNAIQGGVIAGASPIVAIDIDPRKLEYASRLGATHTIDLSRTSVTAGLKQVGRDTVDAVIVAAGATEAIEAGWELVGPAGICVVVGAPPTGSMIHVDPLSFVSGERRLVGSRLGSANPSIDFGRMVELYRAGRLELESLVTKRYELGETNEAFDDLAAGRLARGLIVF